MYSYVSKARNCVAVGRHGHATVHEWVMSQHMTKSCHSTRMRHVTHIKESCPTYDVTHMNESNHTNERALSHIWRGLAGDKAHSRREIHFSNASRCFQHQLFQIQRCLSQHMRHPNTHEACPHSNDHVALWMGRANSMLALWNASLSRSTYAWVMSAEKCTSVWIKKLCTTHCIVESLFVWGIIKNVHMWIKKL